MRRLPVYIIHLPVQVARLQHIRSELERFPLLKMNLVEASDGRMISEADRTKWVSPDFFYHCKIRHMTAGELGCGMSHRKCCEKLLASSDNVCAVFEDDVLLSDRLQDAVMTVGPWLDSSLPRMVLLMPNLWVWSHGIKQVGAWTLYRVRQGAGAYGFLMNKAAAQIRLDRGLPFRTPCDWWAPVLRWGVDIRALSPHPVSFSEDRTDSSIEAERQAEWARSTESRISPIESLKIFIHFRIPWFRFRLDSRRHRIRFLPKEW